MENLKKGRGGRGGKENRVFFFKIRLPCWNSNSHPCIVHSSYLTKTGKAFFVPTKGVYGFHIHGSLSLPFCEKPLSWKNKKKNKKRSSFVFPVVFPVNFTHQNVGIVSWIVSRTRAKKQCMLSRYRRKLQKRWPFLVISDERSERSVVFQLKLMPSAN